MSDKSALTQCHTELAASRLFGVSASVSNRSSGVANIIFVPDTDPPAGGQGDTSVLQSLKKVTPGVLLVTH